MDPHLLRTFVSVVSLRSFSAAAQQLGYTQSAVSQHIAALEASLGTPLVERRPVAPTAAGARLFEHAGPILLRLEAARADVARVVTGPSARRLGVTSLALVPPVAAALPLTVELSGGTRDQIVAGVASGELDAGLIAGAVAPSDPLRLIDTGPLQRFPLTFAEEPLAVVFPLDHPLADRPFVRLGDLSGSLWLDAPNAAIPFTDLRSIPSRTSLRYDGADVRTVLALVAAGHGLALLPQSLADIPSVRCVPVQQPRLVHRVEVLVSAAGNPLLDMFR